MVATSLSTVLGDAGTGQIATVEHLLAAISGLGIDNIEIEIDGDEVPIMDGSAEAFVDAIEQVGVISQAARRRYIKVLKPIRVEAGGAVAELRPHDGRQIEVEIDFDSEVIGRQAYVYDLERGDFREELARARTFGFMRDVERLWAGGFALGASFDNTVVLGDGEVMNPEGLRYSDEFARHKALDAVGDLMLAGAPILGAYRSVRGGHRLNCAMVAALMADRDAWTWTESPMRRETAGANVGSRCRPRHTVRTFRPTGRATKSLDSRSSETGLDRTGALQSAPPVPNNRPKSRMVSRNPASTPRTAARRLAI